MQMLSAENNMQNMMTAIFFLVGESFSACLLANEATCCRAGRILCLTLFNVVFIGSRF